MPGQCLPCVLTVLLWDLAVHKLTAAFLIFYNILFKNALFAIKCSEGCGHCKKYKPFLEERWHKVILNDTLNTVDQSKMEIIGGSDCMVEIRHYSSYFSALGTTSEEIEENSLSDCALLLDDIWWKLQDQKRHNVTLTH